VTGVLKGSSCPRGTGSHSRLVESALEKGGKPSRPSVYPDRAPPEASDPVSVVDGQNPKPSIAAGTRARRIRIAPAEGIVPRRPVVARRGAVANVSVAALAARAKGAAGMVATPMSIVVAVARVDGDVAAAGGAIAVAEGGHCDGGDG
jgi:hypothetical protein